MEDEFFVIAMVMVGVFVALSCCMFGIFGCIAYRKRTNQTLYSTPVVITDQSFTPYNQSQRPQYSMNLQTNAQPSSPHPSSSSLPPYVPQQQPPPLITYQNQPPSLPLSESNIQMPMSTPYNNSSQNNQIYPVSTAAQSSTGFPLNNIVNDNNINKNNVDEDAPPSYFKIDKLRN